MYHDHGGHELSTVGNESAEPLIAREVDQTINGYTEHAPRFGSIALFKTWFPEVEPNNPRAQSFIRKLSDRGISLLAIQFLSLSILIFNLSITIFAMTNRSETQRDFVDILRPGEKWTCDDVRLYNRWLHLGINVLSTLLLGASNYCSQLLVAPTREEINEAHKNRMWFDIGIQSFRNLRRMKAKKQMVWSVLMLSSGLLHLFWNSAVFAATPFSTYQIGLVTVDYLNDTVPWHPVLPVIEKEYQNAAKLEKMEKADCISHYTETNAGLASLLIVSSNITMSQKLSLDQINPSSSLLLNFTTIEGPGSDWGLNNDWMCSAWAQPGFRSSMACTKTFLMPHNKTWTLAQDSSRLWIQIDYCLPLGQDWNMEKACALRASPAILIVVTALNLLKCVCIGYTGYLHRQDSRLAAPSLKGRRNHESKGKVRYLVTIGDAIASFLEEEDIYTRDLDLATMHNFRKQWPSPRPNTEIEMPRPTRWFRAASPFRWCVTISLCAALLGIVGALLVKTISSQQAVGVKVDLTSLWSYGVGDARPWAMALTGLMRKLDQRSGFLFAVLFANMFQVVVSALYLLYNNLLTVMIVASEWNDFISERKTLRLSVPQGIQRSNYFLSLPYRYSIGLMTCSGLLHWLISQSVFVVQTIAYAPDFTRDQNMDASSIGYSSIGIVLAMITGGSLVVALLLLGFGSSYESKPMAENGRKPPHPMPLVGTCSAAISANSHKHGEDRDCSLLPVIWGLVRYEDGRGLGHYTFTTARDVEC